MRSFGSLKWLNGLSLVQQRKLYFNASRWCLSSRDYPLIVYCHWSVLFVLNRINRHSFIPRMILFKFRWQTGSSLSSNAKLAWVYWMQIQSSCSSMSWLRSMVKAWMSSAKTSRNQVISGTAAYCMRQRDSDRTTGSLVLLNILSASCRKSRDSFGVYQVEKASRE